MTLDQQKHILGFLPKREDRYTRFPFVPPCLSRDLHQLASNSLWLLTRQSALQAMHPSIVSRIPEPRTSYPPRQSD